MDRKFVLTGLGYAIVGMLLGMYMAGSKNHGQLVTHAHILLLGFVVSFIYGLCHKLWLNNSTSKLAVFQFYAHQVGSVTLFIGLFLLYGNFVSIEILDPIMAVASLVVLLGVIAMKVLVIQSMKAGDAAGDSSASPLEDVAPA